MEPLAQRVLDAIYHGGLVSAGDRVGVAVSGGADSVALLRLFERLQERLGVTLVVVHFDHGLRGAESEGDARFVEALAREHGLECILEREDVAAAAAKHRWNLEDAARRLRYTFFESVAGRGRATRIAVAHTADDQAETVLAHIIRGTGPTGLAGIYPVAGPVVRPLLGVRRDELRKYLRGIGQGWREDSSNRDLHRLRARIRVELLPLLERDFSPRVVEHLTSLARLSREEEMFWSALVEDRFRALVTKDDGELVIGVRELLAPLDLPSFAAGGETPARALTERLIRRLYQGARGDRRGLMAGHVEQVIHLASESVSGRRVELPGSVVVERVFGRLIFFRARQEKHAARARELGAPSHAYHYVVNLPGREATTVSVPELQRRFNLKVIDWPKAQRDTKSAALDADRLRWPLILRNWKPGDAYRPRGRGEAKKLKRMFLAGRIPSRERGSWPVLESDGRVVWARGMPPADEFSASESTRTGIVIEEDRL